MNVVRWGIIGAGEIVRKRVAAAIRNCENSELVSISRGRADLAEPHLVEALDIARRENVKPLELANTIRPLALVRDDPKLWEEAHALYVRANVPPGIAETARQLARHARTNGDESRAEEWLRIARAAATASSD